MYGKRRKIIWETLLAFLAKLGHMVKLEIMQNYCNYSYIFEFYQTVMHYSIFFTSEIIAIMLNNLKNLKIFLWKKRRFRLRWDSSLGRKQSKDLGSNPSAVESLSICTLLKVEWSFLKYFSQCIIYWMCNNFYKLKLSHIARNKWT